jgi:hypothetical protein
MQKTMRKLNLFFTLALLTLLVLPAYAESLESVRVVKFWDATDDMVVQRETGEKLLLQHNRICNTMSTEFPIQILWSGEKVTEAKVAANEICKVYNFGPYSSDLIISKRIPSSNALTTEHFAEVDWNGGRYQIDYAEGCKYLREYVGETAYVYTPKSDLTGATLYLPQARGECEIASATLLEKLAPASNVVESPIKNLGYVAENNQVFFTWDAFPKDEPWLVLVTYSKYQMDPSGYTLEQLPNLKRSHTQTLKVLGLVNDQPYYFYISAKNGDGDLAPWKEIPITPARTARRIINNPDPELFEVTMTETADAYHLVWPDKGAETRKYMMTIYVNGKREVFKYVDNTQNYFDLEKKPEWSGASFRVTVRSVPAKPTGTRYFDGVFWKNT